jgi:outer membrane protein, multidrug efflux system
MRRSLLVACVLLVACTPVGPDYARPKLAVPETFVEAGPWRIAAPTDTEPRGNWWELFGDSELNRLQKLAQQESPRLQAAMARIAQARAALGFTEASQLPTLDFAPEVSRYGVSGNRPDQPDKVPGNRHYTTSRFRLPLIASYELDLWGRHARQQESANALLEASLAGYQTVWLTLQGDLALAYFDLRAADEEFTLLQRNIELRQSAQKLVAARKRGGLASELDLSRVETELAVVEADLQAAERRRRELRLALALLIGVNAGQLSVAAAATAPEPPRVPVGLPAELLERRPDVAEAERRLAARNAEIGIAKAAYFPSIRLTAGLGYESADLSELLNAQSQIWNLGASLMQPVFDGGRLKANEARIRAAYDENLALYRERLLTAFKEVESALAALRFLELQHDRQLRALTAAEKAEQLADARYRTGVTPLLELIDAQRTRLSAERARLQVRNQQLLASVALIRALGGGWQAGSLAEHQRTSGRGPSGG